MIQNYQLLTWDGAKQKRVDSEFAEIKFGKVSIGLLGDVESAITALDSRIDDLELAGRTQVFSLFENNAQAFADGQPGVQDPSYRNGWYFKNASAEQKINWYFFDGQAENVTLSDFSAYAIVTFDSVASKPFLAVYTTPTGTGDAAPWYKSRRVYIADSSAVAGVKYLMHFGADPKVHPELPRLSMTVSTASTEGTLGDGERVLTAALGSNSTATVNSVAFVAEAVGIFSPTVKRKINLSIRLASKSALDAEQAARISADAILQTNINSVYAALTQEISDRIAADSAEASARAAGDAATLASANSYTNTKIAEVVGAAPAVLDTLKEIADAINNDPNIAGTLTGYITAIRADVNAVEAGLAQELLDRAAGDSFLQAQIDELDAGLEQEKLDRAAADSQLSDEIAQVAADLAFETQARLQRESELQGEIDAEEARALAREAQLQAEIDAIESELDNVKLVSKVAFEAIAAGQICYVKSDGQVAKADASMPLFDTQLLIASAAISAGATGKLYVVEGSVVRGFSGLLPGKKYFLATTSGGITNSLSGFVAGYSVYQVGHAISATELAFSPSFQFEY
jgi:hypothetical protein